MPSILNSEPVYDCKTCDLVKKQHCEHFMILKLLEFMGTYRHKGAPLISGTTIRYCADIGIITEKEAEEIINKIKKKHEKTT